MDLKHLRYFVAVAEELHFTRAAERLNMSQPPLSQIIGRFEGDLGFKLLERSNRKVVLTEAGKVLLEEGRAILAKAKMAAERAERVAQGDVGHLKVAFTPWAELTTVFSSIFRTFSRLHPEVIVDFHSTYGTMATTEVVEGRVDVAFLAMPPEPPRGLQHKLVLSDAIVVALPAGHPLAKRSIVPIKLLADEPQIVVARHRVGSFYQQIERLFGDAGLALQPRHVIDHPQTTMALVAAGAGISLVPTSYDNVKRPGIVYRRIQPSARVNLVIAWRPGEKSSVVKNFFSAVRSNVDR
jgi:DNA-binding transcriptional LysR family regulator